MITASGREIWKQILEHGHMYTDRDGRICYEPKETKEITSMHPKDITFTVEKEVTLEQIINEMIDGYDQERNRHLYHTMASTMEESIVCDIKTVRMESKIEALRELSQKLKQSK